MINKMHANEVINFNQIFSVLIADRNEELGNLISICQYLPPLIKQQSQWQLLRAPGRHVHYASSHFTNLNSCRLCQPKPEAPLHAYQVDFWEIFLKNHRCNILSQFHTAIQESPGKHELGMIASS